MDFRSDAQDLEKTKSLVAPSRTTFKPKEPKKKSNELENTVSAQISYNPPRREPDCRVCCHMKEVQKVRPMPNTVFFEHLVIKKDLKPTFIHQKPFAGPPLLLHGTPLTTLAIC